MNDKEAILVELRSEFKALNNTMLKEFHAIKQRQDVTNGNVSKNTQYRLVTIGFSTCVTVIVLPIAYMVIKIYFNAN